MMSFHADVNDYLQARFVEYYTKNCTLFHDQIERLFVSHNIVCRIRDYPIRDILFDHNNICIQLIFWNFLDICYLIISRLLSDNNKDFISLNKFKNEIIENINTQEKRDEYTKYLGSVLEKKKIEDSRKKLKIVRDSMIAHYKRSYFVDGINVTNVTWKELEELVQYIHVYFNSLLFNTSYFTLNTIAYHEDITSSKNEIPDIDIIIEKYEDESSLIRNIEEYPCSFDYIKDNYSDEQVSYIKKILLRRRIII